jgi:catechol 2,3-dioxygenase-like lactoylglutathione lyase family enzyme
MTATNPELAREARLHGPIVSSSDLAAHARLFAAVGMVERARRDLDAAECTRQWGTAGTVATELALQTPGTPYGVRILQFSPTSPVVVRDRHRGHDADAPKVIDFYMPDFAAGRAAIERAGWTLKEPIAEYDLPEGRFVEGHVWGPDEIVLGLISGPPDFFRDFATVTDRTFSEPQSLSGAVSRLEPAVRFFERAFGFRVVYRYGIEDEGFRELVGGTTAAFRLRAINVGSSTREPYVGLIHYGMPDGSYASLSGRARPPHRGTLGATILVDDVSAFAARATEAGAELLAAPARATTAAFGAATCALVLAPNGGCYQLVEPAAEPPPADGAPAARRSS